MRRVAFKIGLWTFAAGASVAEVVREEFKEMHEHLRDGFNAVGDQLQDVHREVRFIFCRLYCERIVLLVEMGACL